MKILLVNIVDQRDSTAIPHLGVAYLASYLRANGGYNDIKIINSPIDDALREFRPDVVGFSTVSQNYDLAKNEAKKAKKAGAVTVIGGVHITLLPHTLDENIDFAVIGEGEQTFLELIKFIDGKIKDKQKIMGLAFWKGKKIVINKSRPLIANIDTIPMPARDLLEKTNMPTMFTSRGCPYKCIFCSSSHFWNTVRFHSAEYVLNEIRTLIDGGAKHISFTDDLFIVNKKRLEEIVEGIKKEGINKKVAFTMWCRANLITEETARLMKEMNTELVSLGLESGSDEVLRYAKGANASVADNERAVNLLKDNGINVQATFVIGFPIDTRETIMQTLSFIKRSRLDSFEVYMLAPMPATPIWQYAKARGLVSEEPAFRWSSIAHRAEYDFNEKIVLTEKLTKQELFELYKKFIWLRKTRKFSHMARNAIRHPYRVPGFIKKKIFS